MGEKITLVFVVLKFRQLSNNKEEVDDGEVREALCSDVDLCEAQVEQKDSEHEHLLMHNQRKQKTACILCSSLKRLISIQVKSEQG